MALQICPLCNGTGIYPTVSDFVINTVCPVCNGDKVIEVDSETEEQDLTK